MSDLPPLAVIGQLNRGRIRIGYDRLKHVLNAGLFKHFSPWIFGGMFPIGIRIIPDHLCHPDPIGLEQGIFSVFLG